MSTSKKGKSDGEFNAYASKADLLDWVNNLLQLQLTRLEQFASGAVYCQLLDAHTDIIPIHKVNFFAKEEHESLQNYKVLQTGFSGLKITRDLNIPKLSRGSKVETLELLQYIYKYLIKMKPMDGYNGRERRALSLKGGTDNIPIPAWMTAGFDNYGGRSGFRTSSGNWSFAVEPQQSLRAQLKASGSFNPAPHTARPASAAPAASPATAGSTRKPCAPVRQQSKSTAAAAAAAREQHQHQQREKPDVDDDEREGSNVAIFRVVSDGTELQGVSNDPKKTTRLIIPDDVLSGKAQRPLSPGGRSLLQTAVEAAGEALAVLGKANTSMFQIGDTLGSNTDSYAYRGKIRSLQDATATLHAHVTLMVADIALAAARKAEGEGVSLSATVEKYKLELARLENHLDTKSKKLGSQLTSTPNTNALNLQLTQLQKQLTSTAALDNALRAVGTAHAALITRIQREGSIIASRFLSDGKAPAAPPAAADPAASPPGSADGSTATEPAVAASNSKVLKLGEFSMKRLRNGDVYKGKYLGNRKNGDGMYCFVNGDVYEGEFRDDRMAGVGVYTFSPEGRYEGDWAGAVYEGAGSETFAKGSTYHGEYSAGLRNGWGVCRFFNGDYYEGLWSKGLRDGMGMQQCTDDSNYVGDYQRGKRHGYGVYSFPNGDQYLGEYEDDIPHGYGVYVFGSGQKYEGHWEKGKKHGWSIYTVETGQRWAGNWTEGKPAWVHPLPVDGVAESAPGAELTQEVQDNLTHAWAACKNAQEGAKIAGAKAIEHWKADGEVQKGLRSAIERASKSAKAAQAARARGQQLAARLDTAALLVEEGSKNSDVKLVK